MQGFPNLDNGNGKGYNKYKTLLSSIKKKLRIRNMSHLKVSKYEYDETLWLTNIFFPEKINYINNY